MALRAGVVKTGRSPPPPRSLLICCRARMTAWQRAGHEVKVLPCSPLLSLLLCGTRARLRPSCVPTSHKAGVCRLALLDPASFLVALALEVVGVCRSFLAARWPVTGFELEITQFSGVQRRT